MKIKELAVPRTMAKLTECLWLKMLDVAVLAFSCRVRYLMGEHLKVVCGKFSTLS
jgi:hypothetical protein